MTAKSLKSCLIVVEDQRQEKEGISVVVFEDAEEDSSFFIIIRSFVLSVLQYDFLFHRNDEQDTFKEESEDNNIPLANDAKIMKKP